MDIIITTPYRRLLGPELVILQFLLENKFKPLNPYNHFHLAQYIFNHSSEKKWTLEKAGHSFYL